MLSSLHIKNIALIPELELKFGAGLTVLSGETGAGKSIIVDSLNFILGAKADKTMIRHGEKSAFVSAVFDLSESESEAARLAGAEPEEGTLIFTRSLSTDGRGECRVNGVQITAAQLKTICGALVDIHGQHENQSLLKPKKHIELLDALAPKTAMRELKERTAEYDAKLRSIKKELSSFGSDDEERARAADILEYQINEIEAAGLTADEETELLAARKRILNFEKIAGALQSAENYLSSGASGFSVADLLAKSALALIPASGYGADIDALQTRLDALGIEAADVISELDGVIKNLDSDPAEAERVERRLQLYKDLKRKYGGSVEAALEFLAAAREKYERLTTSAEEIARLNKALRAAERDLLNAATELSALRKKQAEELERLIIKELSELGMENAVFKTEFSGTPERCGADGFDEAEFFLSANKGEPPKPLSKIISGGEMSRLMLALKVIAAGADSVSTMIFDEIDAGISGRIGQVIATKLARIAASRQVLCVTHLPQIASMADTQYLIEKYIKDEKTYTGVKLLDYSGMVDEIARLAGGKGITKSGESQAREMKEWSDTYKKGLSK